MTYTKISLIKLSYLLIAITCYFLLFNLYEYIFILLFIFFSYLLFLNTMWYINHVEENRLKSNEYTQYNS